MYEVGAEVPGVVPDVVPLVSLLPPTPEVEALPVYLSPVGPYVLGAPVAV